MHQELSKRLLRESKKAAKVSIINDGLTSECPGPQPKQLLEYPAE
jgi:hypothetical protein